MINIQINIRCNGERLTVERKEKLHRPILVRGHFRMINGRKVYVKTHYRIG